MKMDSVRSRILFIAMFPALAIALVLGTYFAHTRIRDMARNLEERGRVVVKQFAPACQYAVFSGNLGYLEPMVESLLTEPDVASVTIRDADDKLLLTRTRRIPGTGRILYFHADIPAPSLPVGEEGLPAPDAAPPPGRIGSVTIGISTARLLEQTGWVVIKSLLLILLGLGATFLLAGFIARGLVRPIEQTTRAVARISGGQFDVRLPEEASGELLRLQRGINEMAQRLGRARQELQDEVQRATRELRRALDAMEEKNQELEAARREALRASRERTELVTNMSHEIRTPLNGILGFIDLLLRTPLTPNQHEYVLTLRKSAHNLLAIVNDILDFSKLESGRLRLEPVPFDLREPLEDTLDLLSPLAHEKRLELILLLYEDVPTQVVGDAARLRQVLLNLVGNAVKFTPAGSITVRVMLEEEDARRCRLQIRITDTGIGMNEAQQRQLFQAFSQGHGTLNRLYGGSGLGLFICRMLVTRMGGEIGLESREGEGSTFWFTLWLEKQAAPHPPPLPAVPEPVDVLLCCSHALARTALAHPLKRWGLRVTEVDDLAHVPERLAALRTRGTRCLLLVSLVGEENGDPRRLAALRALERDGAGLVVLGTDRDESGRRVREQAGADLYLPKPVRQAALHAALWRLMGWEADEGRDRHAAPLPEPRIDLDGVRVLVVDDSEINRRLIRHQLAPYRVEVDEAGDGEQALELAQTRTYDLILMDIRMPGLPGEAVCRRLRDGRGPNRQTPVIAMTANTLAGEPERLSGFGINETLIKPVSEYRLLECLARWLDREDVLEALQGGARVPERRAVVEEMRAHLLEELPDHRARLQSAFAAGDRDRLREHAHRLAGTAAWCRLTTLQETAAELERACVEDVPAAARARAFQECLARIDALLSQREASDGEARG
ncbi:MAG: response regulator [Gammaproteobacteria bacterium]|nr:MAG: response regulator [Gammaproteobacteria bacterium]